MNDSYKTQLSAACLLLSVAESDEILDEKEIETIQNILQDFFSITIKDVHQLLHKTKNAMENATGLFEFGQQHNKFGQIPLQIDQNSFQATLQHLHLQE